jgi:nucleoside-diphosphate-sugar epimerase
MTVERFLVTGALGCIGAWVVRELLAEGATVTVFDRASDPHRLKLIMDDQQLAQVQFVNGDITDLAAIERTLDEHEINRVIHLAALQVPFCRADPPLGAQVNVVGTVNIFEAVARRKTRIDRVVYASSVAVYDAADANEVGTPVNHDPSGRPATLYGVYKLANEGTAHVYWNDQRVSSIALRPYTVYGVGRDQGLTSAPTKAMFAAAVGQPFHIPFGGRSDYHYTADVAQMFIASARAAFEGAAVLNMRGSVAHMHEVVAAIEAIVPEARGQITFGNQSLPFPEAFDATALEQIIGQMPHTPLPTAIANTISTFRELVQHGQLAPDALLH